MKKLILLITILTVTTLSGCALDKSSGPSSESADIVAQDYNTDSEVKAPVSEETVPILEKISANKAKEMIDASSDVIILDVRTEEEYKSGHIDGAILIPDYEVEGTAEKILEDKSATILVYCRSGRRSALAAQALSDLGYAVVYDFGGIIDWPHEIVTD